MAVAWSTSARAACPRHAWRRRCCSAAAAHPPHPSAFPLLPPKQKFSLLGSTGSIGTQTLDIVEENPDKFAVTALAAGGNLELLAEQVGGGGAAAAAALRWGSTSARWKGLEDVV